MAYRNYIRPRRKSTKHSRAHYDGLSTMPIVLPSVYVTRPPYHGHRGFVATPRFPGPYRYYGPRYSPPTVRHGHVSPRQPVAETQHYNNQGQSDYSKRDTSTMKDSTSTNIGSARKSTATSPQTKLTVFATYSKERRVVESNSDAELPCSQKRSLSLKRNVDRDRDVLSQPVTPVSTLHSMVGANLMLDRSQLAGTESREPGAVDVEDYPLAGQAQSGGDVGDNGLTNSQKVRYARIDEAIDAAVHGQSGENGQGEKDGEGEVVADDIDMLDVPAQVRRIMDVASRDTVGPDNTPENTEVQSGASTLIETTSSSHVDGTASLSMVTEAATASHSPVAATNQSAVTADTSSPQVPGVSILSVVSESPSLGPPTTQVKSEVPSASNLPEVPSSLSGVPGGGISDVAGVSRMPETCLSFPAEGRPMHFDNLGVVVKEEPVECSNAQGHGPCSGNGKHNSGEGMVPTLTGTSTDKTGDNSSDISVTSVSSDIPSRYITIDVEMKRLVSQVRRDTDQLQNIVKERGKAGRLVERLRAELERVTGTQQRLEEAEERSRRGIEAAQQDINRLSVEKDKLFNIYNSLVTATESGSGDSKDCDASTSLRCPDVEWENLWETSVETASNLPQTSNQEDSDSAKSGPTDNTGSDFVADKGNKRKRKQGAGVVAASADKVSNNNNTISSESRSDKSSSNSESSSKGGNHRSSERSGSLQTPVQPDTQLFRVDITGESSDGSGGKKKKKSKERCLYDKP